MRIEYVNKVTNRAGFRELPPGLNPVRLGSHPDNHLVLDSPYVGAEAGAFDNDAAGGTGWRFWNRNGKVIRVGEAVLAERDQYVRLAGPRVVVELWPFVLTVTFTPAELAAGPADDARRLDRACADLVREVHRGLVELHPDDPADRAEWLTDAYIHTLERQTAEVAGRRPDFPPDDLARTELADHLAGVAVRAALVQRLVAAGGGDPAEVTEAVWSRMRVVVPELEDELGRLAAAAADHVGAAGVDDLTELMAVVDAKFWGFWAAAVRAGRVPPRLARYLAVRRLKAEVKDIWFGFGPLEELLADPSVTEVMVVDADHIYIEKNGGLENSGRRFLTDPLPVIQRIMARAGRQINTAQPMADARMPDGSRVNAVIAPLALRGPALTVRRFPTPGRRLSFDALIKRGAVSQAARDFLRAAVMNRRNVVVAGGTGTGKTTLLNALSEFIPDKERVVTVEDTAELQLRKEHVVALQGRQANAEGAGAVSIRDLVRNALRMRPDRIIVGECRGGEAIDMLQAMNTGHDGSMTTLHANTPAGVLRRLEVLVQQNADTALPVTAIHQQIVSAVDLIVQLGTVVRSGRRVRMVTAIAEAVDVDPDAGVRLVPLFARDGDAPLRATGYLPSFLPDLIATGLVPDPVAFVRAAAG